MCAEISYKVMRLDTVYDLMRRSRSRDEMVAQVCGLTIITDYNNTTYKIDRIDFDLSPMSTFMKNGQPISYMAYYQTRHNIKIRDPKQPLLVSKAKARQIRGGSPEEFFLIPELCRLTGISDAMRGNFQLMKAMSEHTRVDPRNRILRLNQFNTRLQNCAEAQTAFSEFGLQLSTGLVEIAARIIPSETIIFSQELPNRSDWTNDLRNVKLFNFNDASRKPLNNWYCVTLGRIRPQTEEFIRCLQKVGQGLGVRIGQPVM